MKYSVLEGGFHKFCSAIVAVLKNLSYYTGDSV